MYSCSSSRYDRVREHFQDLSRAEELIPLICKETGYGWILGDSNYVSLYLPRILLFGDVAFQEFRKTPKGSTVSLETAYEWYSQSKVCQGGWCYLPQPFFLIALLLHDFSYHENQSKQVFVNVGLKSNAVTFQSSKDATGVLKQLYDDHFLYLSPQGLQPRTIFDTGVCQEFLTEDITRIQQLLAAHIRPQVFFRTCPLDILCQLYKLPDIRPTDKLTLGHVIVALLSMGHPAKIVGSVLLFAAYFSF